MNQFVVNSTFPSPILKDFHTYIDYCEKHRPKITNTNEFVGRKYVFELNQMMEQKFDGLTAKNDQNHYPLLHLFYHLCLRGDLFVLEFKKSGGGHFTPNEKKLQYFRALNATEQYFYLLKTLWVYCDWENIQLGDIGRVFVNDLQESLKWIAAYDAGEFISLDYKENPSISSSFRSLATIPLYLEYFGFWKCRISDHYRTRTAIYTNGLQLTGFGKAMSACLAEAGGVTPWNIYAKNENYYFDLFDTADEVRKMMKKGLTEKKAIKWVKDQKRKEERAKKAKALLPFESYFIKMFPEGALGLVEIKLPHKFRPGIYTFHVCLSHDPKISRKIQMDAHHTLQALHRMIQKAYNFDDDHLYRFFMDGKPWSKLSYSDPRGGEDPFADEIKLGDLEHLALNKKILYIFDFGDEWRFDIILEKIDENSAQLPKGKIVESIGKPPKQYQYTA